MDRLRSLDQREQVYTLLAGYWSKQGQMFEHGIDGSDYTPSIVGNLLC